MNCSANEKVFGWSYGVNPSTWSHGKKCGEFPPIWKSISEVWPFFPPKRGKWYYRGLRDWCGLSFHDFPRVGMIFPTLRKELEKAIDLLEQDTPYRFRVVTPPPGYGSLAFFKTQPGSWWLREQNNRKGLVDWWGKRKHRRSLVLVYVCI